MTRTEANVATTKTEIAKPAAPIAPATTTATAPKVETVKDEFTGKTPGELAAMFSGNKSAAMRAMLGKGYTPSQVSKAMNVRPQFVHNVRKEMLRSKS